MGPVTRFAVAKNVQFVRCAWGFFAGAEDEAGVGERSSRPDRAYCFERPA